MEVERSFEDIEKDLDVIKLIKLIKSIPYAYESKSCPFLYVHQAIKALYASYHKTITSCDSYIYSITNIHNFIIHCGGGLGHHPLLFKKKLKDTGVDPPNENYQQVETVKIEAK